MAQTARPASTSSSGNWVAVGAATLHEAIDESSANDSDYASLLNPDSKFKVKLGTLTDPESGSGHVLRYRLRSADGEGMVVRLIQGASTEIASWTHDPAPTSFTTYNQTLSSGEANSISDYSDLYVEFEVLAGIEAPEFIQQTSYSDQYNVGGSAFNLTFPSGLTAGSTIVVALGLRRDPNPSALTDLISSITASGVTFTRRGNQKIAYEMKGLEFWTGVVTTGGATTISIDPTQTSSNMIGAVAAEFANLNNSDLYEGFDGTNHASNGQTQSTAGPVTATVANTVAIAAGFVAGDDTALNWVTPSGYTELADAGNAASARIAMWAGYKILSATGDESVTTQSDADTYGRCSALMLLNGQS